MTAENPMPRAGLAPGPLICSALRRRILRKLESVFTLSVAGTLVIEALAGRATHVPLGFDKAD